MAINKIIYGGETLIDLTEDTVAPETLAKGTTAHDKTGAAIVGTYEGGTSEDLDAVLTEQEGLIATLQDTLRGKASGDSDFALSIIDRSISGNVVVKAETVGNCAFAYCANITGISLPNATSVGTQSFRSCTSLASFSAPNLSTIGNAALSFAVFTTLDLPKATTIDANAFQGCRNLVALILRCDTVCLLSNVSAFGSTPIKSGDGYIYVPASLLSAYVQASNWSTYASQFRAIEDYPEICGG